MDFRHHQSGQVLTSTSTPGPNLRALAEQLIMHEASRHNPPGPGTLAVIRVFEGLRRPLCTLAGVTGLRILLARALTLGRAQVQGLTVVTVEADASLIGLDELRGRDDPEGGIVFLAQLLKLLTAFIGEALTMGLLLDVWPDLADHSPRSAQEESLK